MHKAEDFRKAITSIVSQAILDVRLQKVRNEAGVRQYCQDGYPGIGTLVTNALVVTYLTAAGLAVSEASAELDGALGELTLWRNPVADPLDATVFTVTPLRTDYIGAPHHELLDGVSDILLAKVTTNWTEVAKAVRFSDGVTLRNYLLSDDPEPLSPFMEMLLIQQARNYGLRDSAPLAESVLDQLDRAHRCMRYHIIYLHRDLNITEALDMEFPGDDLLPRWLRREVLNETLDEASAVQILTDAAEYLYDSPSRPFRLDPLRVNIALDEATELRLARLYLHSCCVGAVEQQRVAEKCVMKMGDFRSWLNQNDVESVEPETRTRLIAEAKRQGFQPVC